MEESRAGERRAQRHHITIARSVQESNTKSLTFTRVELGFGMEGCGTGGFGLAET